MAEKTYPFTLRFKADVVRVGDVYGADRKWNKITKIKSVAGFGGSYIRVEGTARQIYDPFTQKDKILKVDE